MKKIILFTAMIAVLAGSAFGQAVPSYGGIGGFESPTSTATVGLFSSDADDFISPSSFQDISFEKWFLMSSFASANAVSLGYATKTGGLYLGLFYHGRFWYGIQTFQYTEGKYNWLGVAYSDAKTYTDGLPTFNATLPLNQLAVLVGLENMGFRFTLTSTYKYFQDSDFIGGGQWKNYEMGNGIIAPQLAWGMAKPLSEKGIQPWATIDLVFNNDFAKGQAYNELTPNNYVAGDEIVTQSENSTELYLNLGLGGVTIAEKNGWTTSFDLEYLLGIDFYENEYDNQPVGSNFRKFYTFKGATFTFNEGTPEEFDSLAEFTASAHLISPSFNTEWSGEALKLSASFTINIGIAAFELSAVEVVASNGSIRKNGPTMTGTTFNINPALALGLQWKIHPRLSLNAGGEIDIDAVTIDTVEGESYEEGNKLNNSEFKVTQTGFGGTSVSLSLGVIFNPADNLSFEAACGVAAGNSVSVFTANANGLFYFSSILAKLTF